ncbi:MAG: [protein-PII] uridylyltransferase [Gammaproteobacteria bacterium]|nr:[protein-PII] uridylyltransferase [Gammaproteobacteria bacterium]MCF6261209.1 [protein-PII] uridylyltransferase [Gammaproteobacteria bacterium]
MNSSSNTACTDVCDWQEFDAAVAQTSTPLSVFRAQLKSSNAALQARFENDVPVQELVTQRAELVDKLLLRIWQQCIGSHENIALVAVGGYGRSELHPASDIDLLILISNDEAIPQHAENIERFLLFLWDLGLEVGHSTRTVQDCIEQATADITVATNLMEARLLIGPEALFLQMKKTTGPDSIWPGLAFFRAKRDEQIARHHRFHDTAYNLEPNIKENPGGLRDLQVIGWVAKRHFGANTLHDLVAHGFLTEEEFHSLNNAQNFLWRIRFALHTLTRRREDRLLFDHQRTLATQFGYKDQKNRLAVEQFMKAYYRTVLKLSRLNEMLLDLFEESICFDDKSKSEYKSASPIRINERFQSRHGKLEVTHNAVFTQQPSALLELFVLMARDPQLRGVSAGTIRLVHQHHHLIDEDFRNNPHCHHLFIELFRQGVGLTHELRRMNRYGVLAAYLPVYGNIVGQMQHDLFHVYTVDEHTMFVVRNLRRLTVPEFANEFPLSTRIIKRIDKQEILTLSAFFHDIGKGRGGDHSKLGAIDAAIFCRKHSINEHDTQIIKWLVENHLLMSVTAQRKDISDPDIIAEFAQHIGNQKRLDHLYLLTVADIRATSPSLWNSWKDALLAELYHATSRALRHGLDNPVDHQGLATDTQTQALTLLNAQRKKATLNKADINQQWQLLGQDYFLRHSADEIAWHTRAIIEHGNNDAPLILIRGETHRGGSAIFVYTRDKNYIFATITATLEALGLNIIDARVITSNNGFTLDTFLVLDRNAKQITDIHRQNEICTQLNNNLHHPDDISQTNIALTRQQKHFPIATKIHFRDDEKNQRTQMEVVTSDRPGLLARIASGMLHCNVLLQNAKIATFGERAEDIFLITNTQQTSLQDSDKECLRKTITQLLDQ